MTGLHPGHFEPVFPVVDVDGEPIGSAATARGAKLACAKAIRLLFGNNRNAPRCSFDEMEVTFQDNKWVIG